MLVILAQKAINFFVSAQVFVFLSLNSPLCVADYCGVIQNANKQPKEIQNQLIEVADDMHQLILKIICDMRDTPDEVAVHVEFIMNIRRFV